MKCQPIISVLHRENDELFVIFRVGGLMFNWWTSVHAKNTYGKVYMKPYGTVWFAQLYRLEFVYTTI